ncbi:DUF736 domain-containing protein [Sphingobium sp. GW456-12-10-14-TSB1]|jgi:uncharacterized protein (DUF736 family)|uniref:DUF736 domain-containing protein n=2 Tax=Sphingomonadaceae TaxID=41297 RepID=A0A1E1EY13_9SPHN|nr:MULTISPECIES: DUF736 domain-containing protein [Sphingomonadaceae]MYL97798.1 DUF736 family protein [Novosphingobium silvae]OUC54422.1 DUF736 domain-containing protein [Sphingobium sp. GW456-12-10-14-TSB1]BAV63157.1 hypothetical protein SCLO_1001170 [Sphingobium cloacae]
MNIGEFKLNKGRILGWIATRTIDLPKLALRPVESENELAPAFEIIAPNVGGRVVQVGALWAAVAKRTGEVFYQGHVDDPSMPEPLPIALFGSIEEGFRAAWRRQERDDFGPTLRTSRNDAPSGRGGGDDYGFGDSTANENGELSSQGAAADLDDEVQF